MPTSAPTWYKLTGTTPGPPRPRSEFSAVGPFLHDFLIGDMTTGYSAAAPDEGGTVFVASLIAYEDSGSTPPTVQGIATTAVGAGSLHASADGTTWTTPAFPSTAKYYQYGASATFDPLYPNTYGRTLPAGRTDTGDHPPVFFGPTYWVVTLYNGITEQIITSNDSSVFGWNVESVSNGDGTFDLYVTRGQYASNGSSCNVQIIQVNDGLSWSVLAFYLPPYNRSISITDFRPQLSPLPPAPGTPVWSGVCEGGQVTISWNPVANADLYIVKLNGSVFITSNWGQVSVTVPNLSTGIPYSLTLAVVVDGVLSPDSVPLVVIPCDILPSDGGGAWLRCCSPATNAVWKQVA